MMDRDTRLRLAESFKSFLDEAPNGLERDLFGKAKVDVNAPLALVQTGIQAQVDLLTRLVSSGHLRWIEYPVMVRPVFSKTFNEEDVGVTRADAEERANNWRHGGCEVRIDEREVKL